MSKCGNVNCFWHDSRGVPRFTIGPSWPFASILFAYAFGLSYIHYNSFKEVLKSESGLYFVSFGMILYLSGIWGLLRTFLGDPGIPEEIFLRYSDPSYTLENGPSDEEEEGVTPPT